MDMSKPTVPLHYDMVCITGENVLTVVTLHLNINLLEEAPQDEF